jgi:uncharacterized protein YydD (DUF2326 family)
MKLLQLSSSNPDFKTINFEPGLNIIVGLQLSEDEKKTINGIGKSLSLILVHLMFGAKLDNKKPKEKKLKNFLKDYGDFQLNFIHNSYEYQIVKNFSKTEFYINEQKISQKDYPSKLNEIFKIDEDLTFRRVFNCFARRYGGDYYSDPLRQQGQPSSDYYQRLTNLKLLGIDTTLVKEQYKIKEQINKLEKAEEVIKEYEKVLDKTNLKDLQDEYSKLIQDKKDFKIAPNYSTIKEEADKLTKDLQILRNEIQKIKNTIEKKKYNLKASSNINIDTKEIETLYNEALFFFEDKVKQRLEDAQKFHNTLISNRKKRIELEIKELLLEQETKDKDFESLAIRRDRILEILNTQGALEEYSSIEERIKYLYDEIKKLTRYEEALSEFKKEKSALTVESALIKEKSIIYLENEKVYLEKIENNFRTIVKKFYDNHGGSLKLKDTKNAKYLYDIHIEIPRGASQAIGEVEIFCYDVLLYTLNKNLINFLAHDGIIFSEMDPRQKAMIFKIIIELINQYDLQYFVNIGENSLKEILEQDILSSEEKSYIKESLILKLFDKDPKSWLMGTEFS